MNNIEALLSLVKAGLWERFSDSDSKIAVNGSVVWNDVYLMAEAQGVTGLVAAGIEKLNIQVPLNVKLQFVGCTLQIEQRNKAMNTFIADLVEKMRVEGIYTLLVKGQGVAQCYDKPLWRASGDVDLLLSEDNYKKAKEFLLKRASGNKPEERYSKHLGINIGEWYVEIHGTLRTGLSTSIDKEVDSVQRSVFYNGNIRSWLNGKTQVFLPGVNEDVFFVFTHFIKHFYKEGMTLRQVCDWSRLLWKYRDKVDVKVLEKKLHNAGLMKEWKAFAALAVDYLGMPVEAMPLYDNNKKWGLKAKKIIAFILRSGEWRKFQDTLLVGQVFPLSTLRFAPGILLNVNWLKIKERLFGE